jgi:putative oxidoreductase
MRSFLCSTTAPAATVFIRVLVGTVFLSEGIQKFLYPADVGSGRFEKIGFPNPDLIAGLAGAAEIACGFLVLLGLFTRFAVVPIIVIMLVALATTKLPILLGQDVGIFNVRSLDRYGFWAMAHEMRTDWAMLLSSLFLLSVGAGRWSLDALLNRGK